jgi:hypothetical protein
MAHKIDADIAVIGAGANGVAFVCSLRHALRNSSSHIPSPVRVVIFDRKEEAGQGNAFYDPSGCARLNVEPQEMHVVLSKKEAFRDWLAEKNLLADDGDWHRGGLVPRQQFSLFIREQLKAAEADQTGPLRLQVKAGHEGDIADITRSPAGGWILTSADGRVTTARCLVIATGHVARRNPHPSSPLFAHGFNDLPRVLEAIRDTAAPHLAFLGGGVGASDCLGALDEYGYWNNPAAKLTVYNNTGMNGVPFSPWGLEWNKHDLIGEGAEPYISLNFNSIAPVFEQVAAGTLSLADAKTALWKRYAEDVRTLVSDPMKLSPTGTGFSRIVLHRYLVTQFLMNTGMQAKLNEQSPELQAWLQKTILYHRNNPVSYNHYARMEELKAAQRQIWVHVSAAIDEDQANRVHIKKDGVQSSCTYTAVINTVPLNRTGYKEVPLFAKLHDAGEIDFTPGGLIRVGQGYFVEGRDDLVVLGPPADDITADKPFARFNIWSTSAFYTAAAGAAAEKMCSFLCVPQARYG